ncbi:hypothetical protein RJ640_003432 [Escallonia rubra]|uniref:Retrovirus-related Pol polyprotein from transposon TNT 1-94-like beta-barrel domain-containing protein n=1 Tax=Escallonia rubra TaxID=112253 RepID=A0AA88U665_9ASTE|nr:hypothetical protein RJ640_003432 [Escallonia rubra]
MAEESEGKIEKFNGMNFQWWKMQVEDYLYQKDMYLSLVGEKPEAMNANEWVILDRKALATVRLSLAPQVAFNISKEKTTAAVMQALEKLYEKPSASNKVFLMKRLFNMRMSENGSVVDHLNDFNGVTNQLESVGINFDDEIRALLFMYSLPDSWSNLVTTVSNSTVSGTRTLNDVVSYVMNDEMKRKTIGDGILSSTALSVESRVDDNFKVWYVDSGASIHCTPHMDCFSDYVHGDYGHVTVGNGYQCSIVGKGKVEIKLSNGGTLVLNDVRHFPELQKNLISVSGLDREGYFVAFGEKQWKVPRIENPEVLDEILDTEIGAGDQQQVSETLNLRRSSRVRKAPNRLCLPLNFIVYTDSEPFLTQIMLNLDHIEEQFQGSSKAHATTLITKMVTLKYNGSNGVREHILRMNDMASQLKGLDMEISEGFFVHFIMTSLPAQFGPFKINYNTQKEKWKMSELISMCVQEEERLKSEQPDSAHIAITGPSKGKGK